MSSSNRLAKAIPSFVMAALLVAPAMADNSKVEQEEITPGAVYLHKQVQEVPWSIHILRVDRNRSDFRLITTMPGGELLGLSPTTSQLKFIPAEKGEPIGAINGDFFSWPRGPYQGDVSGLQITEGELVSAPHFAGKNNQEPHGAIAFWLDPQNHPHLNQVVSHFEISWPNGAKTPFRLNEACEQDEAVIYTHYAGFTTRTTNSVDIVLVHDDKGPWLPLEIAETYSARIAAIGTTNTPIHPETMVLSLGPKVLAKLPDLKEGMRLQISTATTPNLKNVQTALSGSPWLVHNGKPNKVPDDKRNPRAAFGWNNTHYFFVVVDGRRKDVSDGMNFVELAKEMADIGCEEAINYDGGGSAMLWAGGKIRNQPSDNRERPCGNALVLLKRTTGAQ